VAGAKPKFTIPPQEPKNLPAGYKKISTNFQTGESETVLKQQAHGALIH
jgi:hypothetical protein